MTRRRCVGGERAAAPTSVAVFWGHGDLDAMPAAQRSVHRSGRGEMMFQGGWLLPRFIALENFQLSVYLGPPYRRLRQTRDKATDLLSELGLESRIQHFRTGLSGG